MNHKRIANMYLSWFTQEALDASANSGATIKWDARGVYAIEYDGERTYGHYLAFVTDLAKARLPFEDGAAVIAAAAEISSMT